MTYVFPVPACRKTYAETLATFRAGFFSCGFMWEIAKHDEVFGAFLRKNEVPRP